MRPDSKRPVAYLTLGLLLTCVVVAVAAQPKGSPESNATSDRFLFEIIESFDSKYLGDTPGHRGRHGGLEGVTPHVSLGDPVYRGGQQVGTVTEVVWERTKGSLEIEVDPAPLARISIGDTLWVRIAQSEPLKKLD